MINSIHSFIGLYMKQHICLPPARYFVMCCVANTHSKLAVAVVIGNGEIFKNTRGS